MKSLFFLLVFSAVTIAQVPTCKLGITAAPAIRALKLRMSPAEIDAAIPGFTRHTMASGNNINVLEPMEASLSNVDFLDIEMFQGKIMSISLRYKTIPFTDSHAFAQSFTDNFNLPSDAWLFPNDSLAYLPCSEFSLYLDKSRRTIVLTDLPAQKIRQDTADKAFKP
jgi:hypothetical protein